MTDTTTTRTLTDTTFFSDEIVDPNEAWNAQPRRNSLVRLIDAVDEAGLPYVVSRTGSNRIYDDGSVDVEVWTWTVRATIQFDRLATDRQAFTGVVVDFDADGRYAGDSGLRLDDGRMVSAWGSEFETLTSILSWVARNSAERIEEEARVAAEKEAEKQAAAERAAQFAIDSAADLRTIDWRNDSDATEAARLLRRVIETATNHLDALEAGNVQDVRWNMMSDDAAKAELALAKVMARQETLASLGLLTDKAGQ